MFNLRIKLEPADILLIFGVLITAIGICLISKPAAVIFLGIALIVLAFLMAPPKKIPEKKGGSE